MRTSPLIPPPPESASPPANGAPAPQVPHPQAPHMAMDKDFIVRNQVPERYIAGRLPVRGAQDFERFVAAHPELLDELGLPERVHAGLRLLEAGGIAPPWEQQPRRWHEKPATLAVLAALALAGLVAALVMGGKLSARDATIATLRTQVQAHAIEPATRTHSIKLLPSRTAPSDANAAMLGGGAEMGDLRIDVSWSKFQLFRITVDRLDQGRVAVLHNVLRDSNGDLHVAFNTSALGPGSYQFTIEGLAQNSEVVPQAWVTVGVAR